MKRMKRTNGVAMVLGVSLVLVCLQLSCAGLKGGVGEAFAADLADTHTSEASSCSLCHTDESPEEAPAGDVCLACHANYKQLTAGVYGDPHDAHMQYACADCHHAHEAFENQCLSCHNF